MTRVMQEYARADLIQIHLGLSPEVGGKVAGMMSFAGAIEHFLERALWRLRGIDPKGIKPDTDAKMISDLITMLARLGEDLAIDDHRAFLVTWCEAARSGFIIRHNIVHGVPMNVGGILGGRVALLTGGLGSFGRAQTIALARAGARACSSGGCSVRMIEDVTHFRALPKGRSTELEL